MVAILGDTHMPKGSRRLPDECLELLRGSELIVHTGDFTGLAALELIEGLGPPLLAVGGNVDEPAVAARLPQELSFEIGDNLVGSIHDAGAARGRSERLRPSLPRCRCGALRPLPHAAARARRSRRSGLAADLQPGQPDRAPRRSIGIAELDPAGRLELRHVWLD